MTKEVKAEMAQWIFERGKERIDGIGIHYLDVTVSIFMRLLEELDNKLLADKLYKYYSR